MNERILLVDDDPFILQAFQRSLRKRFNIETAFGPEEGLKAIMGNDTYAVIVSDLNMPDMDGVEFLKQAKILSPDSVRVLLTGSEVGSQNYDELVPDLIFSSHSKLDSNEEFVKVLAEGLELFNSIKENTTIQP